MDCNDVKGGTCNEKNGKSFVTKIIYYFKKSLSFSKVSVVLFTFKLSAINYLLDTL